MSAGRTGSPRGRCWQPSSGWSGRQASWPIGRPTGSRCAGAYRVRGAALSGIAAEQLEGGAGIASRTVHSLLFQWQQGKDGLSAQDVLVVDEAGMIGSRQMERLLAHARAAKAKVVLVGRGGGRLVCQRPALEGARTSRLQPWDAHSFAPPKRS
jgi:ATP-dependent exoDNAse (exonuclease V) alpha subunit